MTYTAPVSVLVPTQANCRQLSLYRVLEKIVGCDPPPKEVLVHVDNTDGVLEKDLVRNYPGIKILSSSTRIGPGGGRHRCLLACSAPFAVSFDDDSFPVDTDFFSVVQELFSKYPKAAVIGASIWHRHESPKKRSQNLSYTPGFVGCGFAIRVAAYQQTRGFLPLSVAYGMEETDLSLQLFVSGWDMCRSEQLRVFHDTDLKHHESAIINAAAITNAGLFAFLHYPVTLWGRGLLQVANRVLYAIHARRYRGICRGLLRIPFQCYSHRKYRNAVAWPTLKRYLDLRRVSGAQLD